MDELIINVALTGCVARQADNPALPIGPEWVAADARRCADEGAQVFHIHARGPHGNPAWGVETYRAYVEAVRGAVPGAVVCVSLSGRHFQRFEERTAALYAGPDLGSVTLGSVDFRDGATSTNGRNTVTAILQMMGTLGVKPEFEAFDLGHLHFLQELVREMKLGAGYVNLILGVAVFPTPWSLTVMASAVPGGWAWAATAVGRDAWAVQKMAIEAGAHVRVGLEDSLWMGKDDPATNPRLVARAVAYARERGREPMGMARTREALGL